MGKCPILLLFPASPIFELFAVIENRGYLHSLFFHKIKIKKSLLQPTPICSYYNILYHEILSVYAYFKSCCYFIAITLISIFPRMPFLQTFHFDFPRFIFLFLLISSIFDIFHFERLFLSKTDHIKNPLHRCKRFSFINYFSLYFSFSFSFSFSLISSNVTSQSLPPISVPS